MPKVIFQPYNVEVEVDENTSLLDAARKAGIYIRSLCGGRGSCKKCLVKLVSGEFKYDPDSVVGDLVLACRTYCRGDICQVFIPPETRLGIQRLLTKTQLALEVEPNPRITIRPEEDGAFTILYIDEGRPVRKCRGSELRAYGVAVDIGTTKVAVYVVDLFTGKIVREYGFQNPQMTYGDDIISRIEFCRRNPDGVKILQRLIVDKISEVIADACRELSLSPDDFVDGVVVGNTVMMYLFLGNPEVTKLVDASYRPPKTLFRVNVRDIGLRANQEASIDVLPCVSRYFGSDLVADVLAVKMYEKEELQLLLDIGTNTQIIIGCRDWMIATSGPGATAFEGWGITCGVRATEGAIEQVKIEGDKVIYRTIGDKKPIGLCGSGLVDLVAELLRNGIIDETGRLKPGHPRVRERPDGMLEFVVVPREESGTGNDIVVTQRDIANILDSKAGVCALIATLLRKLRISISDIERVYICGGFATYLNLQNATYIGLIPEFPNAQVEYVGNGAIAGAYMALVNYELRSKAVEIAQMITYVDMVNDAEFLEEYNANLSFPGKRELFPSYYSSR